MPTDKDNENKKIPTWVIRSFFLFAAVAVVIFGLMMTSSRGGTDVAPGPSYFNENPLEAEGQ